MKSVTAVNKFTFYSSQNNNSKNKAMTKIARHVSKPWEFAERDCLIGVMVSERDLSMVFSAGFRVF